MNKAVRLFFSGIILIAISIAPAAVPARAAGPRLDAGAEASERYTVYMVLWRGMTEAERGFINYILNRDITAHFIIRNCGQDKTRLPAIIEDIRRSRPHLVYTFGTTVTKAIAGFYDKPRSRAIEDIPILFNLVADPVGARLVKKMEGSGRNLTGVSHVVPIPIQLKAMKSVSNFSKLGIIYNRDEENSRLAAGGLETLAPEYQFTLVKETFRTGESGSVLTTKVANLVSRGVDLIYLPSDSSVISNAGTLMQEINRSRVPTFSATEGPIDKSGALMGLVSRYYNVGQFAGYKALQILVEKKNPGQIPVEVLSRFSFIVNMNTAKLLNFYPPVTTFKFAEVIEK